VNDRSGGCRGELPGAVFSWSILKILEI
jgi:hypothetical protein